MLDRAVRRFANDLAGTGDVYETYGEGYKVKSLSIDGTDISEWSVTVETLGEEGFEENPAFAAQELQTYIEKECGVTLPVESNPARPAHPARTKPGVLSASFRLRRTIRSARTGFTSILRTVTSSCAGGYKRGTMYAVYEFLENYAGWRFSGSAT